MLILAPFFWNTVSGFKFCLHFQVRSHPNALWTILGLGWFWGFFRGGLEGRRSRFCILQILILALCLTVCSSVKSVCCSLCASLLSPTLDGLNHSVLRNSWLLSWDFSPPLCWKRVKRCACVCANKAGAFCHLFPTSAVSYAKISAWIFLSLPLSPLVKCSKITRSLRYHLK